MKKLLFLGAMAAMLLGTASCSSDMEPEMNDGMVQFTIELPGNVESRAIADGNTANKLTVAVYDKDGKELTDIRVNQDIPHQTTVSFQLVKGQTYSFAFWAQAEGAPYTFDTANKTVNVSYDGAKSNDETRDAFYAYRADLTVTGPMSETIYLYRPFAQLNYGASDYQDAIKAGVNATKSAVTVNHAATAFNLETGVTTGDRAVTFTQEILPNDPETLTVEDKTYQWMAMNYFLVPSNQANIETSLQLYEDGNAEAVRDITVPNVPVEKNHRTNIVGNLFTEDVNFLVIIDERFDQPDYNVDINGRPYLTAGKIQVGVAGEQYATVAEAIAAANGETVYLGAGTYDEAITATDGQTVSIASAGGLSAADVTITKQIKAEAGSTLNLNAVNIVNSGTGDAAANGAIHVEGANATIENVVAKGQRGINVFDGSTVVIRNSELNADGGYSRGISIGGENNNVTVEGSTITVKYYAVNVGQTSTNNIVKISNSNISGWAITNIWGKSSTYEFENCEFTSYNFTTNPSTNAFAAFVTNADADNNTFGFTDCTLDLSSANTSAQYLMLLGGHDNVYNGKNLSIKGENTNTNGYILGLKQEGATYTFNFENVGGTWDGEEFTF